MTLSFNEGRGFCQVISLIFGGSSKKDTIWCLIRAHLPKPEEMARFVQELGVEKTDDARFRKRPDGRLKSFDY